MTVKQSKNDVAWHALFEEEHILEHIQENGYFTISAARINKQREARLMTKFDHGVQLPKLFRDNKLSIQPISRKEYLIGPFESYFAIPEKRVSSDIEYVSLPPHIETIIPHTISSESSTVLCAYLAGMLEEVLGEDVSFTVFGRMTTGLFQYDIDLSHAGAPTTITVSNAQCEIDGGFEGETKFAIIEAKCFSVDDFIIRQLYYPYRLWMSKTTKEVVPIFLTYSNSIFTFHVFRFADPTRYNSIELVSVHRFCIGPYEIEINDVREIVARTKTFVSEQGVPFPQADKFVRVIDLLTKLYYADEPLTKEYITTEYAFDVRQTDYYISAGVYLGLFERLREGGQVCYSLTDMGREIMEVDPRRRNLKLIRIMLTHRVFYAVLRQYLNDGERLTRENIVEIMSSEDVNLNHTTRSRRAQTVEKWVNWIMELTSI